MSEYQYYEFQAVDHPLSDKEMAVLRSYSTRARITPTSFVNDYSWGSFRGDEDQWMERYFDAFLYLANWGTHVLKLRLPSRLLDPREARRYCGGGSAFSVEKGGKVILTFVSEEEPDEAWIEGAGRLSSMISLRAELARGGRRSLYLGWLLRAQAGELKDKDREPLVPPGLGQLSAPLKRLADFLRIDRDLLAMATQASASMEDAGSKQESIRAWVSRLPSKEKDGLIADLIMTPNQTQVMELYQRFTRESAGTSPEPGGAGRTVGSLLKAAEAHAKERQRIEAEKRAQEEARREREATAAREKHLDGLVGRESALWAKVHSMVAERLPKSYDLAVKILVDLRDLDVRGKGGRYRSRIEALRQEQSRKPTFIERLKKAGL